MHGARPVSSRPLRPKQILSKSGAGNTIYRPPLPLADVVTHVITHVIHHLSPMSSATPSATSSSVPRYMTNITSCRRHPGKAPKAREAEILLKNP